MNRTDVLVQAKDSYFRGLRWSITTGLVVCGLVWGILTWALDFWYLGAVLGPVLGFVAGVLSGYAMLTAGRQFEVQLKWQGVPTFLNDPAEEGLTFDTGTHWRPPLCGLIEVPGPDELIPMDLPGEEINTQDGSIVLIGMHEDERKSKPNRVEWKVVDPFKYIQVKDAKQQIKQAYLALVRLFFGEMKTAFAVKSERTLFSAFLELPPGSDDPEFKNRLIDAMFKPSDHELPEPIFVRDAVEQIMSRAGEFLRKCERWGVGEVKFYTSNVRENPVIEAAATEKAATSARLDMARDKIGTITELTKGLVGTQVTPNLAALVVTSQIDQNADVELRHQTFDVPQLHEAANAVGNKVAEAAGKLAEMIRPKEVK